jgi:hypothetical protein
LVVGRLHGIREMNQEFPQSPTSELATLGAPKRKQRPYPRTCIDQLLPTKSYLITHTILDHLLPFIHRYRTRQSSTKLSEWPPTKLPLRRPSTLPVSSRYLPLLRITDVTHSFFPVLMSRSHFTLQPIRYWGKRNTKLILPTNSSLSVTLDQDHLRSTTSSRADASFEKDRLWLNGKEEEIERDGRLWVCIDALRKWRQEMEQADSGLDKVGPL